MKTALTIAGSDSCGGAGIQADIKTMTVNGVYAMSAVTALTAQNTTGVKDIMEVSSSFLKEQLECIFTDIYPDSVKIGMIASKELIKTVKDTLVKYKAKNIVLDPVMVATSGAKLISDDAIDTLKKELLPIAAVVTPNIPEAEVLSGMKISSKEDMEAGLFEHYYPGLKNYQLEYHEAEVNSSEFFNLLKDKLAGLKYILVALGEDELNIKTAVELSHFISRETDNDQIKILTDVYNTRDYSYIQQAKECFKEICLYGSNDNIYTEDIIINESREMTARKIHAYYNAQKAVEKQVPWQALSPIKKMTNISAASHIYTKLQLAGLTPQDFAQWSTEEEYVKALGNERFENLAKGEHLHWNATLFVHEWDVWHLSDIPDFVSVNKDEKHKKHACLVDWEELKKVEERFGEPYRKYDRDSVRNIWELAKANLL